MESKRDGKSKKSKATSSSKERKSRKPVDSRDRSGRNPLQERKQSSGDTDKRKTRRDFFKEKEERPSRPSREYAEKRNDGRRDRDDNSRYGDRNSSGRSEKRNPRFGSDDNRRSSQSRSSSDRYGRERDGDRRRDNASGSERFRKDRDRQERGSFRDRDERGTKRSSDRYSSERSHRNEERRNYRSEDRDNRDRRSPDRFSKPRDGERSSGYNASGSERFRKDRDRQERGDFRDRDERRTKRTSDRYSSDRPHRDGEERGNYRSGDRDRRSPDRFSKPRDGERSSGYNRSGSDRFRRDDDRSYSRPRRNEDDRERSPDRGQRKERRSTVLDSDIMREIVQKRRDTGRTSHKQKVLSLAWSEERGPIRLNKYIANSGICSRREADDLIVAGAILVNGKVVTELGAKVMPTDEVRYEDKILQREKPVYILLNKPKDFITTTDDEKSRDNVMMLIEGACPQRVYPVGRLDRTTTGLLLFTNDGEMTKKLTHPRYGVKKIYQVELDRNMSLADFETLANGIELEDGFMKPDELAFVDGQKNVIGITLHSGKNRIVRRLFAHLGYEVEKLDRVYYAGLTKKDLPRGEWRFLRQDEINILKMSL